MPATTAPAAPSSALASLPAEGTAAHQIASSPAVRSAIDTIVREAGKRKSGMQDVRGPVSGDASSLYDAAMKEAGEARGRALLYPFIGSGAGNGALVELADGSVKWDMITAIGVNFFGHSDEELMRAALEGAATDIVMQGHLLTNADAHQFCSTLLEQAKRSSRLAHVFLCNSGAMANENALKVCYQKKAPASRVIAFSHNFMGRTTTMAQIGDSPANRDGIPLNTLVDYIPFYDHIAARRMSAGDASGPTRYIDMAVWHLRQYIERYPKQHACFIFELVQGEGGFNTALPDFHRALMQVCRDSGVAVWDDEIQTFGRTTEMFAYETMGLGDLVDVLCVGKMSQVCATLYAAEYNPRPGLLSGTFLGSTDAVRVGTRIIERLRDGDYYGPTGSIARHFRSFTDQVRALATKHPDWFPHSPEIHDIVDGAGGMMRFTPFGGKKESITKLCRALFDEGVIVFYCGHGPYHIRMLPPLGVFEEKDWPRVFALVESAMAKVAASEAKAGR